MLKYAKIRDMFFFIRAESHVKKVKISLEKNRFFFRVNIVETMRDEKKMF